MLIMRCVSLQLTFKTPATRLSAHDISLVLRIENVIEDNRCNLCANLFHVCHYATCALHEMALFVTGLADHVIYTSSVHSVGSSVLH